MIDSVNKKPLSPKTCIAAMAAGATGGYLLAKSRISDADKAFIKELKNVVNTGKDKFVTNLVKKQTDKFGKSEKFSDIFAPMAESIFVWSEKTLKKLQSSMIKSKIIFCTVGGVIGFSLALLATKIFKGKKETKQT